ncbi:PREDICTED: uncharacterized protein LOC104776871 [Camelina sativa]|uniref:Uncharacterized protein LOC104776871 n=1 Tax=Camelina sativa TaxID=90675 RepID=A0ABM0YDG1_CAMSA|nr:PREDICTED: uncharacterized protein LOC104776871 [Camelina sativa]
MPPPLTKLLLFESPTVFSGGGKKSWSIPSIRFHDSKVQHRSTSHAKHLVMCRKQPRIAIGRLIMLRVLWYVYVMNATTSHSKAGVLFAMGWDLRRLLLQRVYTWPLFSYVVHFG